MSSQASTNASVGSLNPTMAPALAAEEATVGKNHAMSIFWIACLSCLFVVFVIVVFCYYRANRYAKKKEAERKQQDFEVLNDHNRRVTSLAPTERDNQGGGGGHYRLSLSRSSITSSSTQRKAERTRKQEDLTNWVQNSATSMQLSSDNSATQLIDRVPDDLNGTYERVLKEASTIDYELEAVPDKQQQAEESRRTSSDGHAIGLQEETADEGGDDDPAEDPPFVVEIVCSEEVDCMEAAEEEIKEGRQYDFTPSEELGAVVTSSPNLPRSLEASFRSITGQLSSASRAGYSAATVTGSGVFGRLSTSRDELSQMESANRPNDHFVRASLIANNAMLTEDEGLSE